MMCKHTHKCECDRKSRFQLLNTAKLILDYKHFHLVSDIVSENLLHVQKPTF